MGFISLFIGSSLAPFSTQILVMFVFWGEREGVYHDAMTRRPQLADQN